MLPSLGHDSVNRAKASGMAAHADQCRHRTQAERDGHDNREAGRAGHLHAATQGSR